MDFGEVNSQSEESSEESSDVDVGNTCMTQNMKLVGKKGKKVRKDDACEC